MDITQSRIWQALARARAEALFPKSLFERFPNAFAKLESAWGQPELFKKALGDMLIVERAKREGFPPDIVDELMKLSMRWESALDTRTVAGYKPTLEGLLAAVDARDAQAIQAFAKSGFDISQEDAQGASALLRCCKIGFEAGALALAKAGADVNAPNKNGLLPLHCAAAEGRGKVLIVLLSCGAKPDLRNRSGENALHLAAKKGIEPEFIALLAKKGCDPNGSDMHGNAPLHCAAEEGFKEVCAALIAFGADPSKPNKKDLSPASIAELKGYLILAEALRKAKKL